MKRKILIMTAAALLTLGLATVSAQSPAPAEEVPGEIVYDVVEPQRYEAETPAYTVDANGNITLDVKIHLLGDINGDGAVKLADYAKVLRHVKGVEALGGYEFACADVTGDGFIKLADYAKILRHVKEVEALW